MESKRHQKLYEHYKTVFGEEPIFSLKLKKNVLPTNNKDVSININDKASETIFFLFNKLNAIFYTSC